MTASHSQFLWRRPSGRWLALFVAILGVVGIGRAQAEDALASFRRPAPAAARSEQEEKRAEIGRRLFFEPLLSATGMSCATCHQPGLAWRDDVARRPGLDGTDLPRHAPTLLDVADVPVLLWDGRMTDPVAQATDPILNARVGGLSREQLVERVQALLRDDGAARRDFVSAFADDAVTVDRIGTALVAFQHTLTSPVSAFDRWVAGDGAAVSPAAQRGFALFVGRANCAACHSGWRFTDDGFHDTGTPDDDPGRGRFFPAEPTLQHAFKTPTLRGVVATGPYMHDGSLPTLDAVLTHYDGGFARRQSLDPEMRQLDLTAAERAEIIAFLQTLSAEPSE